MPGEGGRGKKIPMQNQILNLGAQLLNVYFVRYTSDMIRPNRVVILIELQIGVSDGNTTGTEINGAYHIT